MPLGEGVILNQSVEVKNFRLLAVAACDIQPGGMSQGASVAHLRVVDIPQEEVLYVPLNSAALNSLIGQATHVLSELDKQVMDATDAENEG